MTERRALVTYSVRFRYNFFVTSEFKESYFFLQILGNSLELFGSSQGDLKGTSDRQRYGEEPTLGLVPTMTMLNLLGKLKSYEVKLSCIIKYCQMCLYFPVNPKVYLVVYGKLKI